jgi:hypothetical protein
MIIKESNKIIVFVKFHKTYKTFLVSINIAMLPSIDTLI